MRRVKEIAFNYCADGFVHIEGVDTKGEPFDLAMDAWQAVGALEDGDGLEDAALDARDAINRGAAHRLDPGSAA